MADMPIRSTYALDQQTEDDIERLVHSWGVTKAEVIRRSIQLAVDREAAPTPSAADVVTHYINEPLPRNRAKTQRLMKSVRRWRHEDDVRRGGDTQ